MKFCKVSPYLFEFDVKYYFLIVDLGFLTFAYCIYLWKMFVRVKLLPQLRNESSFRKYFQWQLLLMAILLLISWIPNATIGIWSLVSITTMPQMMREYLKKIVQVCNLILNTGAVISPFVYAAISKPIHRVITRSVGQPWISTSFLINVAEEIGEEGYNIQSDLLLFSFIANYSLNPNYPGHSSWGGAHPGGIKSISHIHRLSAEGGQIKLPGGSSSGQPP